MEGITILTQETVRDFRGFLGATFLFAAMIMVLIIMICDIDNIVGMGIAALISIVIGLEGGFMWVDFANDPIPQYKVMISEEVSMVEFYEKYEIIDQEDLIFTVREKDRN